MQYRAYSIRDTKGEVFNLPFYKKTHGEAERDFKTLIQTKNEQSLPSKYPEDFDLYYVGDYDDIKGQFKSLDTPQHVVKGIQVSAQQ